MVTELYLRGMGGCLDNTKRGHDRLLDVDRNLAVGSGKLGTEDPKEG